MADPDEFKLFRTVDPTTVNVPIKEKFAKLTLSNKKKQTTQQIQTEPQSHKSGNVSRQLLNELNDLNNITAKNSYEHPILRSNSSSSNPMGQEQTPKAQDSNSQCDVSDYMEALHMSGEGCTQRTQELDVEALSTQVSNLTMQHEKLPQNESILISSTSEGDNDSESCITISDTSVSDHELEQHQNEPESQPSRHETSIVVSQQLPPNTHEGVPMSSSKVQRIEAFLRDVSFENREVIRRGHLDMTADITRLATADTESMSVGEVDCTQLLSPCPTPLVSGSSRQLDSSKRLAENDTEVNTLCSEEQLLDGLVHSTKRLADNDTELNTVCSEKEIDSNSSRRLAYDDTEVNTPDINEPLSEPSGENSALVASNLDETIPETNSESGESPQKVSSTSSVEPAEVEELAQMSSIQVSSINISAKINIKIHIPDMDSSSAESDNAADVEQSTVKSGSASEEHTETCQQQVEKQSKQQARDDHQEQESEHSILVGDASEDEQFLTHAEKLLNQLYGKAWQTPEVIRTLKRSSGTGGKAAPASVTNRTPLTEIRRQPKARRAAATTTKKKVAPPPSSFVTPNDSALGDFSLFTRAVNSNKLNSTQLPRGACTERRPNRQAERPRTKHIHEDRWRALIDSDSGTDASDDDDADATDLSEHSGEDVAGNDVTYLDLTKNEVEVVDDPDDKTESPKLQKKLDDILKKCRVTNKPKLPATPKPPTNETPLTGNPTRRQLFTPNTGYEDTLDAKRIVDQAIESDSLDQLENVYIPGSAVHKRVQEVKKQLGIKVDSPKAKPVFKLISPPSTRKDMPSACLEPCMGKDGLHKYSFLQSLDAAIPRKHCNELAYHYRENFNKLKEELAERLFKIFNERVFSNNLVADITWSKLLRNTAGRCINKRNMGRKSTLELSVKVLTNAARLRCTLIHEMCHAAAWTFNGEGGHGAVWRHWASRANASFPELPIIKVCHNYEIEFKYTYKCINCNVSSHAHSRSRKVETLRCRQCRGPITLLLNKKNKLGAIVSTPVREPTGFAKFVKENFNRFKSGNMPAAQVLRLLSVEYGKQKAETAEDQAQNDNLVHLVGHWGLDHE